MRVVIVRIMVMVLLASTTSQWWWWLVPTASGGGGMCIEQTQDLAGGHGNLGGGGLKYAPLSSIGGL